MKRLLARKLQGFLIAVFVFTYTTAIWTQDNLLTVQIDSNIAAVGFEVFEGQEVQFAEDIDQEFAQIDEFSFNIPLIGNVTLRKEEAAETGFGRWATSLPQKQLGPVSLDGGIIYLDENNKLKVEGDVTLFGKRGTLNLQTFTSESTSGGTFLTRTPTTNAKGEIVVPQFDFILFPKKATTIRTAQFLIRFKDEPTLTLVPGRSIQLNSVLLQLQENEPVNLISWIRFFGNPAALNFVASKEGVSATFNLPAITMGELIKPLEKTIYSSVPLTGVEFNTSYGSQESVSQGVSMSFTGRADFSQINQQNELGTAVSNVQVAAKISKEEGFSMEGELEEIALPIFKKIPDVIQNIQAIKLAFGYKPGQKPSFLLTAGAQLTIPKIQLLDLQISIGYDENEGFLLGVNATKDQWSPFSSFSIPTINSLTFNNLKASFNVSRSDATKLLFGLGATTTLLGHTVIGSFYIVYEPDHKGLIFKAGVPDEWRFSDSFPSLRGTILERLSFEKAYFLASTLDYDLPERDFFGVENLDLQSKPGEKQVALEEIRKGLTFAAYLPLIGDLDNLRKILGGEERKVKVYGIINPNPQDLVLGAKLTGSLPLSTELMSTGPLALEITGRPSLALLTTLYIKPTINDVPLKFIGRIELDPLDATFAATMLGKWENPFNLQGLSIADVAAQLGLNYAQLVATGLPNRLGLTGKMDIGKHKLFLAGQFDTLFKNMTLAGSLNELSLLDLVQAIANPLGARIDESKVPYIAVKDVELKFAPKTVKIGEITIPQGITVKGELHILDTKGVIDFNVDRTGIRALGYTSIIQAGPLKISASKPTDSPTGGPIVKLILTLPEQEFLLSGKIELADLFKVDSRVSIARNDMSFRFETAIADMFQALVEGKAEINVPKPDFRLVIDFRQQFTDYALKYINEALTELQRKTERDISRAQADVQRINNEIANADRQINEAKAKVEQARADLRSWDNQLAEIDRSINQQQSELYKVRMKIDANNREIARLKSEIDRASTFEKIALGIKNGVQIAALETANATLQISIAKIEHDLERARVTSRFAIEQSRNAAQLVLRGAEEFLDKVARSVAKGTLIAARETANGVLEGAKQSGLAVFEGGKWVARGLLGTVVLKRVRFEGSAREISGGKLPHLMLQIDILQKPKVLNFTFDFKNPQASAKALAQEIVKFFKD
ncbi:MAG: hypothetical protein ACOYT8_05625 [Candidatus Dependentiae bacterium]